MKRFAICLSILATPAVALDDCLSGSWAADGSAMAEAMAAQTGAVVSHSGGAATLIISDDGSMEMLAENMVFTMAMSGMPEMTVAVNGFSSGTMTADGGSYTAQATSFSLVGSANVMGQRMEIPVSSASGGGWGNSIGSYACDGNTLRFDTTQPGSIPPQFQRLR